MDDDRAGVATRFRVTVRSRPGSLITRSRIRILPSPEGAERYLAVNKPAGRVVHGKGGLLEELRASVVKDLALVHRLDRETPGVLLLARDAAALRAAHAAWARDVTKVYLARTRGVPSPPNGVVTAPVLEHRTAKPELFRRALTAAYGPARAGHLLAGRRVGAIPPVPPPGRTAIHPAGRPAATAYHVVEVRGETALVELVPETGRMHQLRVHLAHLGTPLLGDRLYDAGRGPETPSPLLHASRLVWKNPPGRPEGCAWVWEAPLPAEAE
jgi:23S rRNA-/tRNA-specific pseudouridylate synthase